MWCICVIVVVLCFHVFNLKLCCYFCSLSLFLLFLLLFVFLLLFLFAFRFVISCLLACLFAVIPGAVVVALHLCSDPVSSRRLQVHFPPQRWKRPCRRQTFREWHTENRSDDFFWYGTQWNMFWERDNSKNFRWEHIENMTRINLSIKIFASQGGSHHFGDLDLQVRRTKVSRNFFLHQWMLFRPWYPIISNLPSFSVFLTPFLGSEGFARFFFWIKFNVPLPKLQKHHNYTVYCYPFVQGFKDE